MSLTSLFGTREMLYLKTTYIETVHAECPSVDKVAGIYTNNLEDFHIHESYTLDHAYLISAKKVAVAVTDSITIRAGLIAGSTVELDAPKIVLEGVGAIPAQIFAFENIRIKAQNLRIQDLTIKVLVGATLTIDADDFTFAGTVKIVLCQFVDGICVEKTISSTESAQDFIDHLASKPLKSLPLQITQE
jgi:hypothetical protein